MAYFITTLLLGAVALTAFYYTRIWYAQRSASLLHGCQLPRKRQTRDPVLGLQYKFQDIQSMGKMKILPDSAALHTRYGSTYHEPSIFGTTLKTLDEKNIQTVFGLKAREWGIQPWRLTAMRPFCGEGILDTDGSVWERSRTIFKPAFRKSNIEDLSSFENFVRQFLATLPLDGSTVDLQDSLTKLVRLSHDRLGRSTIKTSSAVRRYIHAFYRRKRSRYSEWRGSRCCAGRRQVLLGRLSAFFKCMWDAHVPWDFQGFDTFICDIEELESGSQGR